MSHDNFNWRTVSALTISGRVLLMLTVTDDCETVAVVFVNTLLTNSYIEAEKKMYYSSSSSSWVFYFFSDSWLIYVVKRQSVFLLNPLLLHSGWCLLAKARCTILQGSPTFSTPRATLKKKKIKMYARDLYCATFILTLYFDPNSKGFHSVHSVAFWTSSQTINPLNFVSFCRLDFWRLPCNIILI